MMSTEQRAGLTRKLVTATAHWLEQARPLCHQAGRRLPVVEVRTDLRGGAAGQLRQHRNGKLVIRYNLAMARLQPEAFIEQTVPHEVAHVITHVCHGRVKPHGIEWRRVMAWFGITDAARCHDFAQAAGSRRQQRRWDYSCDCRSHQLTTTRHNRARRGQDYICRGCGEALRFSG